jgi:hypothetical protein
MIKQESDKLNDAELGSLETGAANFDVQWRAFKEILMMRERIKEILNLCLGVTRVKNWEDDVM